MAPWLSIVIPARNDAEALARTLDHLQRLPGMHGVEVIVAAAGDSAGTACAVAGRARLLQPDGSTRAELMNAGAADARGEVLFFFWLRTLDPRFNHHRHAGHMPAPLAFRSDADWEALFASRHLRPVAARWLGSHFERLIHHPRLYVLDVSRD